jgi:hypothetical protein
MENGRSPRSRPRHSSVSHTPPLPAPQGGHYLKNSLLPPPPPAHPPQRATQGLGVGGPRWPPDSPGQKNARCAAPLAGWPRHPAQQLGIIPAHQPRGRLATINRKFFQAPALRSQPRSQAHRQRHGHRQHYARSILGPARPRARVEGFWSEA